MAHTRAVLSGPAELWCWWLREEDEEEEQSNKKKRVISLTLFLEFSDIFKKTKFWREKDARFSGVFPDFLVASSRLALGAAVVSFKPFQPNVLQLQLEFVVFVVFPNGYYIASLSLGCQLSEDIRKW